MNGSEEKPPKILESRKVEEKASGYVNRMMTESNVDRGEPLILIIGVMLQAAYISGYRDCEEDRENGRG